eukprot:TRINITY_DN7367_c0_g1_i1.p1 TRINITY_DN7367_c0_g1~~TRINITY_DN7367_c0_g1_i1.p1  ORF type:complete len:261 (-),score=15.14 TRINITY_DN7367_c0_g1_i1:233-1015(-)
MSGILLTDLICPQCDHAFQHSGDSPRCKPRRSRFWGKTLEVDLFSPFSKLALIYNLSGITGRFLTSSTRAYGMFAVCTYISVHRAVYASRKPVGLRKYTNLCSGAPEMMASVVWAKAQGNDKIRCDCASMHPGRSCLVQPFHAALNMLHNTKFTLLIYLILKTVLRLRRQGFSVKGLAEELWSFGRTVAFVSSMPAIFFTLGCSLRRCKQLFNKEDSKTNEESSVSEVVFCAFGCGVLGILLEDRKRWPQLATFMLATSL